MEVIVLFIYIIPMALCSSQFILNIHKTHPNPIYVKNVTFSIFEEKMMNAISEKKELMHQTIFKNICKKTRYFSKKALDEIELDIKEYLGNLSKIILIHVYNSFIHGGFTNPFMPHTLDAAEKYIKTANIYSWNRLDLSNMDISDIILAIPACKFFSNVNLINMSNMKITDKHLKYLMLYVTGSRTIDLRYNKITKLPTYWEKNSKLRFLNLDNNNIHIDQTSVIKENKSLSISLTGSFDASTKKRLEEAFDFVSVNGRIVSSD